LPAADAQRPAAVVHGPVRDPRHQPQRAHGVEAAVVEALLDHLRMGAEHPHHGVAAQGAGESVPAEAAEHDTGHRQHGAHGSPKIIPAATAMIVTGIGVTATTAYSAMNANGPHSPSSAMRACRASREGSRTFRASQTIVSRTSTSRTLRSTEPQGTPERSRQVSGGVLGGGFSVSGIPRS